MVIRSTAARALVLLAIAIPPAAAIAAESKAGVSRKVGAATVAVDPATGRLVAPTSEERRRLAEELLRMFEPRPDDPVVERRANGTRIVMLDGRNPTVTVLTLGPDGAPHLQCLTDEAAATGWLEQLSLPASTPEAEPER
jgi:hypothetical protein